MKCSPASRILTRMRYFLFPRSKIVEEQTKEIEQSLVELRKQKALTAAMVRKITQPDVLRSLVISMNSTAVGNGK